ncbi:MAG: hypothetical protein V7K14_30070 [Nostoc sp.]|uniref:hypothetical protein n=1 Tax=Nostoc sp. TaxID=1180 RepID=UPI002FFA7629
MNSNSRDPKVNNGEWRAAATPIGAIASIITGVVQDTKVIAVQIVFGTWRLEVAATQTKSTCVDFMEVAEVVFVSVAASLRM